LTASANHERLRAELSDALVNGAIDRVPLGLLHVLIDLDQPFDRPALEGAVSHTLAAFPVLGCVYDEGFWRDRWLPWDGGSADLVRLVDTVDPVEVPTLAELGRPFDVSGEPLFRVVQLTHPDGVRLMLTAHHLVADGGGMKAIAQVVGCSLCGGEPHPPAGTARSPLIPARTLRPADLPTLAGELLREAVQPLSVMRIGRIEPPFETCEPDRPIRWRSICLDAAAVAAFQGSCRALDATLNDGLVGTVAMLAARRSRRGLVGAAYTIDLRRYLSEPALLVTNLHAVSLVALDRAGLTGRADAIRAASAAIGEQKRRLLGMAYVLLPTLLAGWLPHGLLRGFGRLFIGTLLSFLRRVLAMTNIGSLDEALAPFGDHAVAASIVGPFVLGLDAPVTVVTGFRGTLTLHVCAPGTVTEGAVDSFVEELSGELAR
jgi:NRPS condensation-like uncharacterized protein